MIQCEKCGIEYNTPYCTSVQCLTKQIIRTELPEQGFLTYIEGYKYPVRALPWKNQLDAVALTKRSIISLTRFRPTLKGILRWFGDIYAGDYGDNLKQPLERLSPASRELYRTLEKINPINDDQWVKLITMIFDTDLAYRTRGQDMFSEVNKVSLQNNPRKEILRVFKICISREVKESSHEGDTKSQLRKMKTFNKLLWWATLLPPYRQFIFSIFREIDVDKMTFDINDRYWVSDKFDYNFEGKTFEERQAWRRGEDKTLVPTVTPPLRPDIFIQQPNEAFYRLTRKEAELMAEKTKQFIIRNYVESHR